MPVVVEAPIGRVQPVERDALRDRRALQGGLAPASPVAAAAVVRQGDFAGMRVAIRQCEASSSAKL